MNERMYQWYLIGCRMQEREPMTRDAFMASHILLSLGGSVQADIFDRTTAEWELAREDAYWTDILQRLQNMNLTETTSDLVEAIQHGRDIDEEDGSAGNAGAPVHRPPFLPVLVGGAAMEIPGPEPPVEDLIGCGSTGLSVSRLNTGKSN